MDNTNNQLNCNSDGELFKDIDKSEIPWMIIKSYFKNNHLQQLIKHQIESYNNFIELEINKTVEMFNPLIICSENDYVKEHDLYRLKIEINFKNLSLFRPQIYENNGATKILFPQEARTRNFTYSSALTLDLDIDYIITNGEDYKNVVKYKKVLKNINFGRIPVMLKSNICVLSQYKQLSTDETYECYMDPGGYFIINGSEKTVLGQERASENKIYCFNISKNSTKWSWIAEIKCVPDWKCISPKQINLMIATKNNGFGNAIYLQIPRLKNPIPLFIIFRAFNVISDKDICEKILINIDDKIIEKNKERKKLLYCLKASIVDANTCLTQEDAIKYILTSVIYNPINIDKETGLKKKREFTMDVLDNDIFPNCKCNIKKIYMLGYMTNILLKTSCGLLPQSDRDSYTNKKIDLTGNLLNNLFRNYFNKLVKDMVKQITKEINNGSWKSNENYENIINNTNIYKIVKSTTIENGIKRALATGDFGIKQLNTNKVGVAQVLNRLTYISSLSHLRRINTPIDKSGKLVPPRRLHNSSWGFLCPAECFDPETPIMMWDGNIKRAGDIVVGDILIDDLGNPTKVRSTCSGIKNMYDIVPNKSNFIKHRVTDNHILTLRIRLHKIIRTKNKRNNKFRVTFLDRKELKYKEILFDTYEKAQKFVNKFNDDDTIDITIEDYLKLNNYTRSHLVLFKTDGINWDKKEVEMDPYLLGMWLGDGSSNGTGFALNYKTDFETLAYWENWAENNGAIIKQGKNYKYSIASKLNLEAKKKGLCVEESPLKKYLNKYNLVNNKHIPIDFIVNDKDTRLKVLAGLIDTDGNVRARGREIRITQGPKNYRIIDDAYYLATSLGFSCGVKEGISSWIDRESGEKKFSTYKELRITGSEIYQIPTLLPRKKLEKITDKTQLLRSQSFMCSLFELKEVGMGNYVGWQLHDKRGRFLLYGGLSVHNTPEGASVGVVKNLSYLAHITIYSHSDALYEYVNKFVVDNKKINNVYYDVNNNYEDKVKVFINGIYQGVTDNPKELYDDLKDKKYKGILNIYTSIIFDTKLLEIRVCNEAGRLTRPLLKLKDRKPLYNKYILDKMKNNTLNFYDLLITINDNESIVEYVDSIEQEHILIAMNEDDLIKNKNYKYTHMEIHPSSIFGILASCIPFPENNQSPRNTYQSAMGKQAMGMYVTNFQSRMDKTAYVLTYPMRPLVDTRIMNIIKLNTIPSGCQVIVAIASYTGYNQEDSILFNKGSIDRGLFSATIYHTEKDEDKKLFGNEEIRCKPDNSKTKNMKFANYSKLNSNGVIEKDKLVEDRDVIIGKIAPIKENKNDFTKTIKFQDESRIYRTNEETYVDKNLINKNGDGYNFCKVRLRNYRKPNIGDKFCIKETALILTESGWISLKDIDINKHKVATLKNNKELDYVYAVEKYEFDCIDEELYYMKSQQVDMVCTKEHKLYVKKRYQDNYEFIEAKNAFGKRIKYKKDALNTYSDIKNIVLDKKTYDMDGFLMLLGSFISDGWVETGKKYKRINISMIKKRKRDYIKNVLDDLNIHCNFKKDRVLIGNTYNELIDYFKLLSVKASNKFLPDFVWKLSQRQSIILMNSLMQGDGSYNKQGSCGYYTSSVKLANQIQQLALHCGWSGTIKLYKNKEAGNISKINERVIKSNYNNYCIRIIKTKNNPEVNHGHTHEQTAQEEKYIKYTGKVGCIEVPDTHLFYYKEDIYSSPVWTGNSSRHKLGCAEKHSAQLIQALN